MSDSYNTRIKLKRDTEANWTSLDPVLLDGEVAIVRMPDGDTRKKIGDGTKKFSELPYDGGDFVQYTAQTLTDEQQKQARVNIDAASDFVVNVTVNSDNNQYTIDKTFSQIREAALNGKRVLSRIAGSDSDDTILPLMNFDENGLFFCAAAPDGNKLVSFGIEVKRTGGVRAGDVIAPALESDGKFPQQIMAEDPVADMQIATKKYVDDNSGAGAVKYDAVQTLTEAQQKQARDNIGANVFVVTATASDPITPSATPEEILAAHSSGKVVVMSLTINKEAYIIPLIGAYPDTQEVMFGGLLAGDGAGYVVAGYLGGQWGYKLDGLITKRSYDAVLYTAQTLTDEQKKQARENIGASVFWVTLSKSGSAYIADKTFAEINAAYEAGLNVMVKYTGDMLQCAPIVAVDASVSAAVFSSVVVSGDNILLYQIVYANNTWFVAKGQLASTEAATTTSNGLMSATDKTKLDGLPNSPLVLAYSAGKVTGATYAEVQEAISSGRQIKLSVANTLDIIASNAKNETNKSVLKFISTDVGGDTVSITDYKLTAQASGLTVSAKSIQLP